MIVVTGATGNVGRTLTQALAEAGEQVTAVSRHAAAVPSGARHVQADLARPQGLGADYLVGVGIRPWWLALLILPPVALFAWWLVARWRS